MGLLSISESGPVDGGVWSKGSDHQWAEHLALIVEEVLAPVVLVRGGGCDCGRGVGGAQIGIISGRRLLRLETRNLVLANSLRKPSEDDECGRHSDGTDHDGHDGSDDDGERGGGLLHAVGGGVQRGLLHDDGQVAQVVALTGGLAGVGVEDPTSLLTPGTGDVVPPHTAGGAHTLPLQVVEPRRDGTGEEAGVTSRQGCAGDVRVEELDPVGGGGQDVVQVVVVEEHQSHRPVLAVLYQGAGWDVDVILVVPLL